ncbi:MAG: 1-deoxy-D-xylulose-5-phosphate synthase N-terminal domain-containing protein [Planctomycetota bacterium]|nr:1-deoxy-D-xylulose-5-phosphate synthase N-terminal domain-containing protein [Planctomycetota bacterium]
MQPADKRGRLCRMRRRLIELAQLHGAIHIASALSCLEIVDDLLQRRMRYRPAEPLWADRDRLILSKGHGALALYLELCELGVIRWSDLKRNYHRGKLRGCLTLDPNHGIEASTGSLGQGLSLALGIAMAFKRQGRRSRIFVVMGDGECQEGMFWEALHFWDKMRFRNIRLVIDNNGLQGMGELVNTSLDRVRQYAHALPIRIVRTRKGQGIPFMEGNNYYHYCKLSEQELCAAFDAVRKEEEKAKSEERRAKSKGQ